MIEIIILNAAQGLCGGFTFGVIEEWNKKALLAILFVGSLVVLLGASSGESESVVNAFTPLWGYAVFFVFFVAGNFVGRGMYSEVTA